jgi:hypothetical protein
MANRTSSIPNVNPSVLSRGLRGLRRVKPISTNLGAEYSKAASGVYRDRSPREISNGAATPVRLLRVWLKSPWNDYSSIRTLSSSGESQLAYRKGGYFQKATIKVFSCSGGSVRILQQLSHIQHPNLATIYDVYCYEDKICTAIEYLELSLAELDFEYFELEEWEVATIIAEVRIS